MINSIYRSPAPPEPASSRLPIPEKLFSGEYCFRQGCQRRVAFRWVCTAEGGSKSLLRACEDHGEEPVGPVLVEPVDDELYEALRKDARVLVDRRVQAAVERGYLVTHYNDCHGPMMVEQWRLVPGPGVTLVEGQAEKGTKYGATDRPFSDVVWRSATVRVTRSHPQGGAACRALFDDALATQGSPPYRVKSGDEDGNRVVECRPEFGHRLARAVIEYEAYLADEARVAVEVVHAL